MQHVKSPVRLALEETYEALQEAEERVRLLRVRQTTLMEVMDMIVAEQPAVVEEHKRSNGTTVKAHKKKQHKKSRRNRTEMETLRGAIADDMKGGSTDPNDVLQNMVVLGLAEEHERAVIKRLMDEL